MKAKIYILLSLLLPLQAATATTDALKIARAIQRLQPNLPSKKLSEYALGIHRASRKFNIDPTTLIAIAQQESSFRENLPEGAAGEIGICQIRKTWLKNPKFIDEFGVRTVKELANPANNFLFSAWILNDLKKTVSMGSLPYWSYYNAVRFENRFRYFLRVNRKLAALRRSGYASEESMLYQQAALENPTGVWKPDFVNQVSAEIGEWKPESRTDTAKEIRAGNTIKITKQVYHPEKKGWIADALWRLWQEEHAKESKAVPPEIRTSKTQRAKSIAKPQVLKAAAELEVQNFRLE